MSELLNYQLAWGPNDKMEKTEFQMTFWDKDMSVAWGHRDRWWTERENKKRNIPGTFLMD